jgi:hypothetical protein
MHSRVRKEEGKKPEDGNQRTDDSTADQFYPTP